MDKDERLHVLVGMADACELFSRAFAFPDRDVARALADGALQADLVSCLADAGVALDGPGQQAARSRLDALAGRDAEELFEELRCASTRVFFAPGQPPVFPYESAFVHVRDGKEGVPALFRSRLTLDVERQMRAAGVLPKKSRTEPCDSVDNELAFLSYAYGQLASAVLGDDEAAAAVWSGRIETFARDHVATWMDDFLQATMDFGRAGAYADLALCARPFVRALAEGRGTVAGDPGAGAEGGAR